MRRLLPALAALLILALTSSAEEAPAGEPEVLAEEIVAPAVEWDQCQDDPWCGDAPPWYEDPASVDCGDRPGCEAALQDREAPA